MKKVYPERSRRGLTAIEMIVVISIIGILVGMIVPTLSKYLPGIQLNGSARTLTSNLREAQEKAVTEQNQHLIRFFPLISPPAYRLIRIYQENEEIIREVTLPNGQTLTLDQTISNDQIIFSADGGPSSSGNITIGTDTITKIINVSPAGFIKIQ